MFFGSQLNVRFTLVDLSHVLMKRGLKKVQLIGDIYDNQLVTYKKVQLIGDIYDNQ